MKKKKLIVKAPLLSRSGYGEQARIAIRALRTRPDLFDIYLLNISWGGTGCVSDYTPEIQWIHDKLLQTVQYAQGGGQFDVSLQITIPNEFEKIAPVDIGYTAGIETTMVAGDWIHKCNEIVDRIITISEHSKKVFEATSYHIKNENTGEETKDFKLLKPVQVVNYPAYEYESAPAGLDIPFETHKNFLCISQWGIRKNLENTIKWFVEEFRDDEDVGLVLKTNVMSDCTIDREMTTERLQHLLDTWCGERKCKIYLLHGELTTEELTWLYQHPSMKAMINLAHGEGYGLPLFEAAYNGLPLVTVTWSGQMDFICKTNKKGKKVPLVSRVDYDIAPVQEAAIWDGVIVKDAKWAYARESSYKRALRDILTKEKHFKNQAAILRHHIKKTFSEEAIYRQFVEAVYGEPIIDINIDDLPKISIITSVFDAEEHIEQLMEDVTRQTIFKEKCEWVILNANGPNNNFEEEVIMKYVEKYPDNIVYKRLDEDPGIYATWNMAIKMATGEYITNVNCDDRRAPWAFESQAKCLTGNPDADLVYNDSYMVNEANQMWEDVNPDNRRYNFDEFSKEAMLRGNLPHNNPMWRKDLHEQHGYFNAEYRSASDWDFWLKCSFAGSKFQKLGEVLGVYYFNPKGMSTNPENFEWKQKEEKEIFKKYFAKLRESKATAPEGNLVL